MPREVVLRVNKKRLLEQISRQYELFYDSLETPPQSPLSKNGNALESVKDESIKVSK